MSSRLANIQTSLVEQEKSRLQLARESVSMCGEALKDLVFGAGNFNSYVKPTLDFIDQNRLIFTQHNIEEHSLTEQRKEAARMTLALRKFWKIDMVNEPFQFSMMTYAIAMYNGGISTKSLLHYLLYSKSLILYQSN